MSRRYNKFLAKCDFLHRAAYQLALEDEENAAAWMQAQEQLQPMQDTIERIYQKRSQARTQRPGGAPSKRELADAFFQGKCRRCGSTVHSVKDYKVSAEIVCRNYSKAGHLAKICASHIFSPHTTEQ